MEKKPEYFPKQNWSSTLKKASINGPHQWTTLLRSPRQISPKWKQGQRFIEQMPHFSHQARTTQSSFHPSKWTESKLEPWLRHLVRPAHPHSDCRAALAQLPYLQQQSNAKSTLHLKKSVGTSVMSLPRPKIRAKKTKGSLTSTKHSLILPLSPQNQVESPWNPGSLNPVDSPGPDHLPKIFPDSDHPVEDLIQLHQKPPSPSIPNSLAEIPPSEGHRLKADAESHTCPDFQAAAISVPVSPWQQSKASPTSRYQIGTTNLLARLHNQEPRVTAEPSSSFPDGSKSRAIALKSSGPRGNVSKESCPNLRPTVVTLSLLRFSDYYSRAVAASSSHLNQRSRARIASQAEKRHRSITQVSFRAEKKYRQTIPAAKDNQDTIPLDPNHKATLSPLDSKDIILPGSNSQATPPFIPDLDQAEIEDVPNLNIQILPAGLNHNEKMAHAIDKQANALMDQDHGSTLPLRSGKNQQEKPQSGLDYGSTSSPGPAWKFKDTQDFMYQKPKEAKLPKRDQQAIILIDQDPRSRPLGLDQEDKAQTGPKPLATLPFRMDHEAEETTPDSTVHFSIQTDQEKPETISSKPDSLDTILTVWEEEAKPVVGLNKQNNIATGPENQSPTLASPDHQEKDILDSKPHVLFPVGLNHWGTISQGIDKQFMEPIEWDFWESALSLSIRTQERTLINSGHWDIHACHPYHQTAKRPGSNTLTSPQREEHWETIPQGSDYKATTLSDKDHRATPSPLTSGPEDKAVPLSDHHTTLQTNLEHWAEIVAAPNCHVSLQMEKERWEITPLRTGHQDTTLSNQWCTRPPVNLNQKGNILSGLKHQVMSPTSPEKHPGDSAGCVAHVLLQTEQQHPETMAIHQDIAPEVQNHPLIPPVSLDPQYLIPFGPTPEATLPPSPNKQKEDTQVLIIYPSIPTEPEHWVTRQLRTHQATTLMGQNEGVAIPLSSEPQDTNLDVPKYPAIFLPGLDHKLENAPDYQTQAIPLSDQHHFQILVDLDHAVNPLSTPKPQMSLPCSNEKQTEAPSHSIKVQSKLPSSLFHTKMASPNPSYRVTPPLGDGHQVEPSKGQSYQNKFELSARHQDQVQTRFQPQIQTIRNRKIPWCLNYIKPYNVEGGFIPARTIQTIVNSIPQQKMKNDICKQILLRRMRVPSLFRKGRQLLTAYPVCLICTSWIPYGCSHIQKMKCSCVAQLLAIPTPLPGPKEELGVKFVLQLPKAKFPIYKHQNTPCKFHKTLPNLSGCPLHSSSPSVPLPSPAREKW